MNIISRENGLKLNIEKSETYRYLGYHFGGAVPLDPEIEKLVDELTLKVKECVTPRCIYEIYDLEVRDSICCLYPYETVDQARSLDPVLEINSTKLANHIRECRKAILFAATMGPGTDILTKRFSGRSTIKPAVVQAAGAAAIEAFADEVTEQIRAEVSELYSDKATKTVDSLAINKDTSQDCTGIRFKMRFSPGYGDFSLEHQKDFFNLLQLERNLGMSLNSALLMSPSKSITAVIGVL